MSTIHTGEEGIPIIATLKDQDGTVYDMSGGHDTLQMHLRSPSGTVTEKDAEYTDDGSDGKVQYTLAAGDVDEPGTWHYQVYRDDGGGAVYYSTLGSFEAVNPLST